jgi:hypothetical protein
MAATARPGFAPYHRFDRSFFAAFVIACWIGVFFGFYPASSARMMGKADYVAPTILHIHALLFVGWLVMLTAQVALVRTRRTAIHRKIGLAGFVLVPAMVYSGLAAELFSQRFYIQRTDDGLAFFILPLFYVAAFAAFAVAALLRARRDPAGHKRLLLMATAVIVGAAYARWWGSALRDAFGNGYWGMIVNTFAGTNLILAAAIAFDLVTRGRPHRVYLIGVPVLVAGQPVCSWIYHAPWWPPLSRELIEIRLPLSG